MGRTKTTKISRSAEIKYAELDITDKRLLALVIKHVGITKTELAKLVNVGRHEVAERMNKAEWRAALDEWLLPPKDFLKKKENSYLRKYSALGDHENESVRERALAKLLITQGILKADNEGLREPFEPITIVMPYYEKQIVITDKPKEITGAVESDNSN